MPEQPRVKHPYFDAQAEVLEFDSAPFGRVKINVVTHGEGPTLLLLHGLMTSSYSWRYMLEPLGQRFRLVIPDLPGAGASPPMPARSHSAPALAKLVGEIQEQMGILGCMAVGNSLGGYICMLQALREPQSFARLAVIHSPGVPVFKVRALHVAMRLPGVAAGLCWKVRRDPLRWAHRNVHYYDESLKSMEEARAYGSALASADGAKSFARYLTEAVSPRDLSAFAKELEERRDGGRGFPVPLFLIYSDRDPLVSPAIGKKLHELIPSARFQWLENTSHFAHVDSPDRLAPLLTNFFGVE